MRIINREGADKIVKKLGAQVDTKGKAHDIAKVYHEGKLIAMFGIRRGSNKEQGHDHIVKDLHLNPRKARLLAQCPLTKEQWIDIMSMKGKL